MLRPPYVDLHCLGAEGVWQMCVPYVHVCREIPKCTSVCVCICGRTCSFDVGDLHIPWVRRQPFIFYSFCHLWPRQLLWHRRLSKQTPSHDMQPAAASAARARTADAVSRQRIKVVGPIPRKSPATLSVLRAKKCFVIQWILLLVCYQPWLVEKTSSPATTIAVVVVAVHTLLAAGSFRLSMQLEHLSTTQFVSQWQVYLQKQTEALFQGSLVMFNSLHLALWVFNYSAL